MSGTPSTPTLTFSSMDVATALTFMMLRIIHSCHQGTFCHECSHQIEVCRICRVSFYQPRIGWSLSAPIPLWRPLVRRGTCNDIYHQSNHREINALCADIKFSIDSCSTVYEH